jgi:hypothetical protein
MTSQTRVSKRPHSAVEPDSPSPSRAYQRVRKPTTKLLQGTLGFSSRLSQVSTPTSKSPTPVSSQASSPRPISLSPTPQSQSQRSSSDAARSEKKKKKPKAGTIASTRRTHLLHILCYCSIPLPIHSVRLSYALSVFCFATPSSALTAVCSLYASLSSYLHVSPSLSF